MECNMSSLLQRYQQVNNKANRFENYRWRINRLTPEPAVPSCVTTHPQFPELAVTGHGKPPEDSCLSYPP